MTPLGDLLNDMEHESRDIESALETIAHLVEDCLHAEGFADAHCRGHFQFGLDAPDNKAIILKLGQKRYAALVKDCFDYAQAAAIAEMFLAGLKNDRTRHGRRS